MVRPAYGRPPAIRSEEPAARAGALLGEVVLEQAEHGRAGLGQAVGGEPPGVGHLGVPLGAQVAAEGGALEVQADVLAAPVAGDEAVDGDVDPGLLLHLANDRAV